ncbi:hypothetical protein B0J17DRAFT_660579 [Rhizoctonia solani]|nr:hypothetical protein B0J17DRAFT_660579 [Rhizoctonia solani]
MMIKGGPTTSTGRAGHWDVNFIKERPGTESDNNPQEIPIVEASESLERHPEFFFDDTLITIQIGRTLFKVHKYQLAKSEVFSDMFKTPRHKNNGPEEGSSAEYPIKLEGVAASDFAALLRVLYASQFSSSQLVPEAPLIISAFRLANMFKFTDLRAYLLPLVEKSLDDVDKIVFAREFGIKEWPAPAHIRLCKREGVLSTEEASKLGVQSVLLISRMREKYRSQVIMATTETVYCKRCAGWQYYGTGCYTCQHCHTNGRDSYLLYLGPGTIGTRTTTNDTALEEEVKKWTEDEYITKC